jgi:transcription elongation factor Elf1
MAVNESPENWTKGAAMALTGKATIAVLRPAWECPHCKHAQLVYGAFSPSARPRWLTCEKCVKLSKIYC